MKQVLLPIIYLLTAALILGTLGMLFSDQFGAALLAVGSDSAELGFPEGSLLYFEPVKPQAVKIGDVIACATPRGSLLAHRVAEIDNANQQFIVYQNGDHEGDPITVPFHDATGIARQSVPMMGYALSFVNTLAGKIILGVAIANLILVIVLFSGKWAGKNKK